MDELFDAATESGEVEIPPGWGQGRATFGGLLGGLLQARSLGEWRFDPATLRATTTSFVAPVTPEVAAPGPAPIADLSRLYAVPYLPGLTPEFLAHIELTPATGGMPFSGSDSGDLTGFMRYRQAPAAMTLPHFLCLVDGWPPAAGAMLTKPTAMSTLSWTVEMLTEPTPPINTGGMRW